MRKVKKILLILISVVTIFEIAIFITGYEYLNKAIWYNFSGIEDYQIFENRLIRKSNDPDSWSKATIEETQRKILDEVARKLEDINSVAFLVIHNDSMVYEKYWEDFGPASISNSFSMAKSYVSALIGVALKKKWIKNLEEPVANYVPHFKKEELKEIKIIDLLTMSSGIDWKESYVNPFSITTRAYYGDDLKEVIEQINYETSAGKSFKYLSGNTQVLAFILMNATGKSLSQLIEEELWQPMGSENDALWCLDDQNGIEKAYCCINSNARDFARLGNLYLHEGNWKGAQLIDSNYVKLSTTAYDYEMKPFEHYGYQWWILPEYNEGIFYARGIHGQYIIIIPSKKTVVVRLGRKRMKKSDEVHPDEIHLIIKAITNAF